MKIYYIANARMPTEKAHGIQLAKMCESFIEAGADLELILPNRDAEGKSIQDYYGLRTKIPVKKLPIIDVYSKGRFGFIFGSCSFMVSYFFYIFWQAVRGESGVIYTIDMDQFSFSLVPFLGMPYFAEVHDAKEKGFLFYLLFRCAEGIIVINSIIKKKIVERFGIDPEKIIVHPNGIDYSLFRLVPDKSQARKILNLPLRKKILLYVGKIYPWKGMDILVKAASSFKNALVYLVGGDEEELKKSASQIMLSPNIICVGHRDYKEIPVWLAAADVFLVLGTKSNDYSYFHTSPMKLFEYMISARPIVASRTPANCEIVSRDEACFYEPDNVENLAFMANHTMANRTKMKEMVENAFKKAKLFSWDRRAASILDFIKQRI